MFNDIVVSTLFWCKLFYERTPHVMLNVLSLTANAKLKYQMTPRQLMSSIVSQGKELSKLVGGTCNLFAIQISKNENK